MNNSVVTTDRSLKFCIPSLYVHRLFPPLILGVFYLVLVSGTFTLMLERNGIWWAKFLDELIFFIFIALVCFFTLPRGKLYVSPIYPWLVAFSLLGFVSSIFNRVPVDIALLGFLLVVKPLIILITYQTIPLNKQASTQVLRSIDRLFIIVTVVAVVYTLVFEMVLGFNPLPGNVPAWKRFGLTASRSFFTHPSPFSSIMTIASLYHFSQILLVRSKRSFLLLLLSISGVFLSLRLKALFLLPLIMVLIYFLKNSRRLEIKPSSLILGTLLVLVGFVILGVLVDNLQQDLHVYFSQNSSAVRTVLIRQAIAINRDTLGMGAGFGMYGSAVSVSYHYSPLYYRYGIANLYGASPNFTSYITDQWWAWFLGEVGILGTALFMVALLLTILRLRRMAVHWHSRNPILAACVYTAIGAMVFGILSGFADANLTSPPAGHYIMGLAGLTFALHRGMVRES